MQKIAQNVGSSIDSLNAKILLMQNELSSLKVQNKGISDSLKTLNETLKTADIAANFYDTHLATYTAIFGIIITIVVGLATLINWFGLFRPINIKFQKLEKKIKNDLETFKTENIDNLYDNINNTTSYALRTIIITYENTVPSISFVFTIRLLDLYANWDFINNSHFEQWLNHCQTYLEKSNFSELHLDDEVEEMEELLLNIIGKSEDNNQLKKLKKIQLQYLNKIEELKEALSSQLELNLKHEEGSASPNPESPKADDE